MASATVQPQRIVNPVNVLAHIPLHEGDVVADFGAGAGGFSVPLARAVGEGGTVYAIDIRPDMLRRLKRVACRDYDCLNVTVIVGDIEEPGGSELPDASVNGVVLANTLFQLDEPQVALEEAYRVCKPGGWVALIEWRESFAGLGPPAECVVSEETARRYVSNAGFRIAETLEAGTYHYGLLAHRPTTAA